MPNNLWHFVDFTDDSGLARSLMIKRVRRCGRATAMVLRDLALTSDCWLVRFSNWRRRPSCIPCLGLRLPCIRWNDCCRRCSFDGRRYHCSCPSRLSVVTRPASPIQWFNSLVGVCSFLRGRSRAGGGFSRRVILVMCLFVRRGRWRVGMRFLLR